jgi:hypothetical protein
MSVELISDLEPPKDLKVNTKGLSPCRAELAQQKAWKDSVSAQMDVLGKGRRKLEDHIAKLEAAVAASNADTVASADSILDKIKAGLSWSVVPSAKPAPDHSRELEIARTALVRLDTEMASLEALVESLGLRILATARRAVYQHGAIIRQTYEATVESMRDMLVQLVALDRLTGSGHAGRLVVDIPAFSGLHEILPIRIEESDIEAARRVWAGLLMTWQRDPHAEAELEFPPHDPNATETITYHELTATERQLVDQEFVGAAVPVGSKH